MMLERTGMNVIKRKAVRKSGLRCVNLYEPFVFSVQLYLFLWFLFSPAIFSNCHKVRGAGVYPQRQTN